MSKAELQHVARLEKRVAELEAERAGLRRLVDSLRGEIANAAGTERLNVIVPRTNLARWEGLLAAALLDMGGEQ